MRELEIILRENVEAAEEGVSWKLSRSKLIVGSDQKTAGLQGKKERVEASNTTWLFGFLYDVAAKSFPHHSTSEPTLKGIYTKDKDGCD